MLIVDINLISMTTPHSYSIRPDTMVEECSYNFFLTHPTGNTVFMTNENNAPSDTEALIISLSCKNPIVIHCSSFIKFSFMLF